MKRTITIFGTMLPALALAACGGGANTTSESDSTVNGPVAETPADPGNLSGNDMAAVPTAMTGQQFADTAAASDAYEVAAGKLASTKATSKGLKDFGAMMVTAHTGSTAKLKAAAAKASPAITPSAEMTAEQKANLATLQSATGEDFDTAYKSQQITAHHTALSLMQGYAATGDVLELKTFAGTTAPVVQEHLDKIQAL